MRYASEQSGFRVTDAFTRKSANPILTRAAMAQDLVKAKEQKSSEMGEAVRVAKLEPARVQQMIERKTTDIANQCTRMDKQADEMAKPRARLAQLELCGYPPRSPKRVASPTLSPWQKIPIDI